MATPDVTDRQMSDLAYISGKLRAALHSSVESQLNDPETVHDQDGHVVTVADDGNGHTVLVVDGARIDLDDQDVADLCGRLIWRTIRGRENASYRLRACHDLLRDLAPDAF